MKKVLITDSVHTILIEGLEEAGFQCHYQPDISYEKVKEIVGEYHGLIINSKIKVNRDFIDKAVKLEFVGRLGSGMEIFDLPYAKGKGINCYNSPEGNRDAVAEHAIGMLLSLFNNINQCDAEVRQYIWQREKNRGVELGGKTIALLGYGNTGKTMAKKLSGFDVKVLAYDKYLHNYSDEYAEESTLDEVFEKADILSLHLPLTNETENWINKSFLSSFSKKIYLINTSRGKIVNLIDLIRGLERKELSGLCLDVFPNENYDIFTTEDVKIFNNLYDLKNTILSPHVAGWTFESKEKMAKTLLMKILKGIDFQH
ncbi:MAG: NAD(P)-dependent oxidoreductase [Chitinophagales bacterium]